MEKWKVIPEYTDYEVSNKGKIRNKKGQIIKAFDNGRGYLKLYLWKDRTKKNEYVHRIVAMAFIPNPENKPFINHIDNNPLNNNADNLEWCTPKENSDWMISQERNKRTDTWLNNLHKSQEKQYRAVKGINIGTGEIIIFSKLNNVRKYGFEPSCVCNCCKGKRKSHAGYRWEYVEGEDNGE